MYTFKLIYGAVLLIAQTKSIQFASPDFNYRTQANANNQKPRTRKPLPGKVACDTCKDTNRTLDQNPLHAELEDHECRTPWLPHRWKVYIQTPCHDGDVKTPTVSPGGMYRHGHAIKCKESKLSSRLMTYGQGPQSPPIRHPRHHCCRFAHLHNGS